MKPLLLAIIGMLMVSLISCGQPVCVLAMGSCGEFQQTTPFSFTADRQTIFSSQTNGATSTTLTFSGGKAPYKIEINDSSKSRGYLLDPSNNQVTTLSNTSSGAVFHSVTGLSSSGTVTLTLTDSSSPSNSKSLTVTVSP